MQDRTAVPDPDPHCVELGDGPRLGSLPHGGRQQTPTSVVRGQAAAPNLEPLKAGPGGRPLSPLGMAVQQHQPQPPDVWGQAAVPGPEPLVCRAGQPPRLDPCCMGLGGRPQPLVGRAEQQPLAWIPPCRAELQTLTPAVWFWQETPTPHRGWAAALNPDPDPCHVNN